MESSNETNQGFARPIEVMILWPDVRDFKIPTKLINMIVLNLRWGEVKCVDEDHSVGEFCLGTSSPILLIPFAPLFPETTIDSQIFR